MFSGALGPSPSLSSCCFGGLGGGGVGDLLPLNLPTLLLTHKIVSNKDLIDENDDDHPAPPFIMVVVILLTHTPNDTIDQGFVQ
jgi:hypothetical protein